MPLLRYELKTGVYAIVNKKNGKRYVGSAARSLTQRWVEHRSRLNTGIHANKHLLSSWCKYGSAMFDYVILERCLPHLCLEREQYWIDFYRSYIPRFGYNKAPLAVSALGVRWTAEARTRLSEAKKGKTLSAESIRKRTEKVLGSKRSEETKARMSLAAKKRGISDATRQKIIATNALPEYRKAASERMKGRKASVESRLANSLGQKRRFQNIEERKKLSRALAGNRNRIGRRKLNVSKQQVRKEFGTEDPQDTSVGRPK